MEEENDIIIDTPTAPSQPTAPDVTPTPSYADLAPLPENQSLFDKISTKEDSELAVPPVAEEGKATVVDAETGSTYSIPRDKVGEALKNGLVVESDYQRIKREARKAAENAGLAEKVTGTFLSALDGLGLGQKFTDEVLAETTWDFNRMANPKTIEEARASNTLAQIGDGVRELLGLESLFPEPTVADKKSLAEEKRLFEKQFKEEAKLAREASGLAGTAGYVGGLLGSSVFKAARGILGAGEKAVAPVLARVLPILKESADPIVKKAVLEAEKFFGKKATDVALAGGAMTATALGKIATAGGKAGAETLATETIRRNAEDLVVPIIDNEDQLDIPLYAQQVAGNLSIAYDDSKQAVVVGGALETAVQLASSAKTVWGYALRFARGVDQGEQVASLKGTRLAKSLQGDPEKAIEKYGPDAIKAQREFLAEDDFAAKVYKKTSDYLQTDEQLKNKIVTLQRQAGKSFDSLMAEADKAYPGFINTLRARESILEKIKSELAPNRGVGIDQTLTEDFAKRMQSAQGMFDDLIMSAPRAIESGSMSFATLQALKNNAMAMLKDPGRTASQKEMAEKVGVALNDYLVEALEGLGKSTEAGKAVANKYRQASIAYGAYSSAVETLEKRVAATTDPEWIKGVASSAVLGMMTTGIVNALSDEGIGGMPSAQALATSTIALFAARQVARTRLTSLQHATLNTIASAGQFGGKLIEGLGKIAGEPQRRAAITTGIVGQKESRDSAFSDTDIEKIFGLPADLSKEDKLINIGLQLNTLVSDPETIGDAMADGFGVIQMYAPKIGEEMLQTGLRGFTYLQENIPKPVDGTPIGRSNFKVSDSEYRKFKDRVLGVTSPQVVLINIARGTATKDQIDAMYHTYPALKPKIQEIFSGAANEALIKNQQVKPASSLTKSRVSTILQQPVSPAQKPGNLQLLQNNFVQKQDGPGRPRSPNNMGNMGASFQTEASRVANRNAP